MASVSLSNLTTLRVGGTAAFFHEVTTLDELRAALRFAEKNNLTVVGIGAGSNILASDDGFPGLLMRVMMKGISYEETGDAVVATVGAGEAWDEFVHDTLQHGLYGLENLSGIPGLVGAAPIQNIGAYGAEVKDTVISVEAFDIKRGLLRKFNNNECAFTYRDSFFKSREGRNFIITSVSFLLTRHGTPNLTYKDLSTFFGSMSKPTLMDIRAAVLSIRAKKFPDLMTIGTAGSFFKNPIVSEAVGESLRERFPELPSFPTHSGGRKIPLAWILDHVCNLRGYREGNVGLYREQPLVLVNFGGATAHEIDSFAKKIAQHVREMTGIVIQREVISLGTFSD